MNPDLQIGGHISLGPRPVPALQALSHQGFRCLQIHASSPRTWRIPAKTDAWIDLIRNGREETGLSLYLHAIYLINLASEDCDIREKSIRMLRWNLEIASRLGAKAVTFHVGSHRGEGFDQVRPRIADGLHRILHDAPSGPLLLIENSAGAGDCIGRNFEEIQALMDDAGNPANLGCCLDTAHAFAMGNDLRSTANVRRLAAKVTRTIGFKRLKLIHLNDSKTELGALRDRHENIGAGCIGDAGFANLLAHPRFSRLPMILETPHPELRAGELSRLLALVPQSGKSDVAA